jgi:putative Mg2+ transporter-C (MgtC) family protein
VDIDIVATNWQEQLAIAAKVAIAGVLGGLVGIQRELANRPAGLRTHAILAAAAAFIVGIAEVLVGYFVVESPSSVLRVDPIRIIEATVTGVAFLGAGTIFRHERSVEGLTTASSLLLVAAIGIAVALRQLLLAAIVTALALLLLRALRRFSHNH